MSYDLAPLMPVRRLHNFLYCPRLFYLQWVEDLFVESAETVSGSSVHKRVDGFGKRPGAVELDKAGVGAQ